MSQGEVAGRAARGAEAPQARGASGLMGERGAQFLAALITVGVFGALSYGLNTLFMSLGQ